MTPFNPGNKRRPTSRDLLHPITAITDQADADQYKEAYVRFLQNELKKNPRKDAMTAKQIADVNIGYYAGYFDSDTQQRINRLFKTRYPIFG